MDRQRQRPALTAAERSLEDLVDRRFDEARRAARRASELDQVAAFARWGTAVERVGDDLERGGMIDRAHHDPLESEVGSSPMAVLIEPLRPPTGADQ